MMIVGIWGWRVNLGDAVTKAGICIHLKDH